MRYRLRLAPVPLLAAAAAACALPAPSAAAGAGVVISPLPGTPSAMPQTQISFLGAGPGSLSAISVLGSSSGRHRGRLRSYSAATGTSFLPSKPFKPGERVSVRARWSAAKGRTRRLSDSFSIATPAVIALNEFPPTPGTPADVQNFFSQPTLHPPVLTVHQAAGARSSPGLLFTGPFMGPGQYGPAIYDNAGNIVWFRPVAAGEDAADFRTQTYAGKPVLTWWQGHTVSFGFGLGKGVIADSHYRTLATVKTGNGLPADEHEFKLTPEGAAWLLAYSPVQTSLASAGGAASGIALDCVIEKVDIRTGLVMWEWHSLGHVDVSESVSKPPNLATNAYDYFHINSLDADRHGNLLISARNTSALYELNARTGAIVWRLGGKKSTFMLGPGVAFAYQHNALWLPGGEISLYDDEGAPPVKPPSRGEVVKLNTATKTATLAAQFVRTPGLLTLCCGNTQPLSGGNWMVGWGGLPNLTEFNAQGQMIYDAQLPRGEFSYRVYREPWRGQPSEPPALVVHSVNATPPCTGICPAVAIRSIAAYASWNGATDVASWQLLTGATAAHLSPVSTTPKGGFETVIPAPGASFYEVRALSASGAVLATSAAVPPS
jgi:outer membrane protein assembly factor BamB